MMLYHSPSKDLFLSIVLMLNLISHDLREYDTQHSYPTLSSALNIFFDGVFLLLLKTALFGLKQVLSNFYAISFLWRLCNFRGKCRARYCDVAKTTCHLKELDRNVGETEVDQTDANPGTDYKDICWQDGRRIVELKTQAEQLNACDGCDSPLNLIPSRAIT
jgi:hypothetical protein